MTTQADEPRSRPSSEREPMPSMSIVMGTYQGERFITQQLDSIARQTHNNWQLYVTDDGSTDNTINILNDFAAQKPNHRVTVTDGPRRGFAGNFLSGLCKAPDADYYAFADQDDVWQPEKLSRAIAVLEREKDRPALYCGRTHLIDESGETIGLSPAFTRPPAFANALVQSLAGGNTMVLNHAMRQLVRDAGKDLDIVSHDWWLYQLVTGAGGFIHYDLEPTIFYRQHADNLVGKNSSALDRLKRIKFLLKGGFSGWTNRNIAALKSAEHLLTPENRALLKAFDGVRSPSLGHRYWSMHRTGIYRQTKLGTLGLHAAILINKV